jgi:hypothetical protein
MDASDVLNNPYCCRCSNNSGGSQDEHFVTVMFGAGDEQFFIFWENFCPFSKIFLKFFLSQKMNLTK